MYLHKTYVPEELFTKEEGKASRKVQSRHAFGADNTAGKQPIHFQCIQHNPA